MAGVSQETFDMIVRENEAEFDMGKEEAVADALEQLKGQDLSGIAAVHPDDRLADPLVALLKGAAAALPAGDGLPAAVEEVCAALRAGGDRARALVGSKDVGGIGTLVDVVQAGVDTGAAPVAAGACEALGIAFQFEYNRNLVSPTALDALVAAADKFADDERAVRMALGAIRLACIKNENNRQDFVERKVVLVAKRALECHAGAAGPTRAACGCLRALTLNDDPRAPMGKGVEHSRLIADEENGVLEVLVAQFDQHGVADAELGGELASLLGRIALTKDVCKRVADAGVLDMANRFLAAHKDNTDAVRKVCSVLRAVAGDDDTKKIMVEGDGQRGLMPTVNALRAHMGDAGVVEHCTATIALFGLRSKDISAAVASVGALELLIAAMVKHKKVRSVQRNVCLAVRNLSVRNPENREFFLENGAETLLRQVGVEHETCADVAKAALRDLGCEVEFREEWTGEKNKIGVSEYAE